MKFFVALSALAAVASADVVNPALTLPYAYGVHAFGGKSAPCVNGLNLPVPCAGAPLAYAGLPYAAQYGKREAEADPQVILGGLGYGLGYHAGVAAVAPAVLGHAALPNPVHAVAATPAGLVHSSHVGLCTNYLGAAVPCRRKRSAEPHHGYGFHGLPHGLPLGYKSAPCVNAANHPVPCASALHHPV